MLTKRQISLDFFSTPGYWHRVDEGKKIAGICTGIAQQLDSPVLLLPLRLFFVLTTFFYGFGIILYAVLWILMPPPSDTAGGERRPEGDVHDAVESSDPPKESAKEKDTVELQEGYTESRPKRPRFLSDSALVMLAALTLIPVYTVLLESLLGIQLSPFLLSFGFISGCCLLAGTGIAIHYRKSRSRVTAAH